MRFGTADQQRSPRAGALPRVLRIQPGEGRTVGLMVALFFAATAGVTIGESGTSALFFERIGAEALPVMYLALGATGIVVVLVLTAWLARFDQRRAYVVIPLVIAAILLIGRAILTAGPIWIYPALWLVAAVTLLLQTVFLWGTAGLVTDTRRAKRLFPLFGGGGILGAVVGGIVTPPIASAVGAENLLLVWVVGLVCAGALCATALGVRRPARTKRPHLRRRAPSASRNIVEAVSYIRRSPLLMWMMAA